MTIVRSSALTSGRAPRPEPMGATERNRMVRWGVDPNRVTLTSPTRDQWDLLEYAYEEECAKRFNPTDPTADEVELYGKADPDEKHPVVAVIPPSHGGISTAYSNARVLELYGYITLTTGAQVGNQPQHQMPWLYLWRVRLTTAGVKAVQEHITRRIKMARQRAARDAVARLDAPRTPSNTPAPGPAPAPARARAQRAPAHRPPAGDAS